MRIWTPLTQCKSSQDVYDITTNGPFDFNRIFDFNYILNKSSLTPKIVNNETKPITIQTGIVNPVGDI